MDITKSNFKEKLGSIITSISEASFISIDGEFTGISNGKGIHAFDTPEERYLKLKEGASNFLLIQFGLCTFHYDASVNRYTHRAFNFYLFPKPFKRSAPDCRFMCQASSLDFLAGQGFDFNKLICEGLSYLTPSEENKLRTEIKEKHESFKTLSSSPSVNSQTPIAIPPENEEFIANICVKIDLLLESSDDEPLELPPANRFLRKLIYQTGRTKYNNLIHMEGKPSDKDNRLSSIIVTKVPNEEKLKELEDAKLQEELDELDDAVGFCKIIKMISKSKKLLIGHNMILDLMLSIHQFSCPLPDDYEEFKALAQSIFPRILDTKLMASMPPFKGKLTSTALGDLHKQLYQKPFKQLEIDSSSNFQGYSSDTARLHEAGYDAFITGSCFVAMCNFLGQLQSPSIDNIPADSVLLDDYRNKVFLLRVQDIPYMNLGGQEVTVNRDHVFHLSFPKEWKTGDVHQVFSTYGAVYVAWIDDSSAYVALKQSLENPANVIETLGNDYAYKITTYKEHFNRNKLMSTTIKPVPKSDVNLTSLKRKRKASLELKEKRSIDMIPEEDELEEQPTEKKKKSEEILPNKKTPAKKIFDESDSWEV